MSHGALGYTSIAFSVLAAIMAAGYALIPRLRRPLRWPMLAVTTLALAAVLVTAGPGRDLLETVKAHGSTAEIDAAQHHAKSTDLLALAVGTQLLLAALAAHLWLKPGAGRSHRWAPPVRWLLVAAAVATVLAAVLVILAAHDATALHPSGGY